MVGKVNQINNLHGRTAGHPEICVAVLDGPVDLEHPCFEGANIERLPTLIDDAATADGAMSQHGTHIASVLFGQPGSAVEGIAPRCRGLVVPVFSNRGHGLSQLDLARAIRQALDAGAHIINVSGGQFTPAEGAVDLLRKAVQACAERNVLIVAAAGNDGCDCVHVPAALPAVLAVGAMDAQGRPMDQSNWGAPYQTQGILAPGQDIEGAMPGGGVAQMSGTSFATPIVSGVAALLLCLQRDAGHTPDPRAVRAALLQSARACDPGHESRCLVGTLDAAGAMALIDRGQHTMNHEPSATHASSIQPSACTCSTPTADAVHASDAAEPGGADGPRNSSSTTPLATPSNAPSVTLSNTRSVAPSVTPSQGAGRSGQLLYALGVLGYDFGTEARRDSFKQLMPAVNLDGTQLPANPYDARQMVDYLGDNLSEARSLIWTLNLELTPIYALVPGGPFARDVYQVLQQLLDGQIQPEDSDGYIERVSIPGRLTDYTVRLFSGQTLPVIELGNTRGMYGWNVNALREAAVSAVVDTHPGATEEAAKKSLESFLNRVYYELRNLGQTSSERAMNFAATNAFQVATAFSDAVGAGMELDTIQVEKSPFCRMDSDCWDVVLSFFDADNVLRARKMFRFTVDVSDIIPVTMGEIRSWSAR